jgi:lipase chaperone LimK|tara:strand:+ start:170 stop:385 length:216 start_codon:yes stop_codon:yes gene_type:complete
MDHNEITEKIAAMETEQARAREALQNALQQAQEARAMLQRQEGYLIALKELQSTEPAEDNNGQIETEILQT